MSKERGYDSADDARDDPGDRRAAAEPATFSAAAPDAAPAPTVAAPEGWEPEIIAFCCNYCAYAAADLAGSKRMQYPTNVRIIHAPCTGKIEMEHILAAFLKGIDGILVAGCLEGGCHFMEGNLRARKRTDRIREMLAEIGIGAGAAQDGQPLGSHGADLCRERAGYGRYGQDVGAEPAQVEGIPAVGK